MLKCQALAVAHFLFGGAYGPFREGRDPHAPKWEGYLITSVKDPVKELAETKDAYVSYLVSAKV